MGVRIVHVADVHLDAVFTWAGPELGRVRRRAIRDALTAAIALARRERADLITLAGDLYEHERSTSDTGQFLADLLAGAGVPVLITPGNHDWLGPASLYARQAWPGNVHIFTTASLTPVEVAAGLNVWGAAHLSPANTRPFLDSVVVDRPGINLALFHGAERASLAGQGADKVPHAPFDARQIRAAGFVHALVGHYHRPVDADSYTYPGNPEPLTFGESGERGAVIVDVADDGQIARSRHHVSVGQLTDLTLDVTGLDYTHVLRAAIDQALRGQSGLVRLTLTGEISRGVDLAPASLTPPPTGDLAVLIRRGRLRTPQAFDDLAAEHTVRGEFLRRAQLADLDADVRAQVIATGLRALAGERDLEVD
jgi:DNA repair protein SbcD/Mre11